MNTPEPPVTSDVLFARLGWMFFGPLALGLTGLAILKTGSGWATLWDLFFFALVALILGLKWYELRSGQGTDSQGRPATMESFPRFVVAFGAGAIGAWFVLNLVGNHVIN